MVFPHRFDCRIHTTKFLTHESFLFPIFYLLYHFKTSPAMLKTSLMFMTVAMLSRY